MLRATHQAAARAALERSLGGMLAERRRRPPDDIAALVWEQLLHESRHRDGNGTR